MGGFTHGCLFWAGWGAGDGGGGLTCFGYPTSWKEEIVYTGHHAPAKQKVSALNFSSKPQKTPHLPFPPHPSPPTLRRHQHPHPPPLQSPPPSQPRSRCLKRFGETPPASKAFDTPSHWVCRRLSSDSYARLNLGLTSRPSSLRSSLYAPFPFREGGDVGEIL